MRLLDVHIGKFVYYTEGDKTPPYAILSHTWDPTGEQTYQEVREIQTLYIPSGAGSFHQQPSPSTSSAGSEPTRGAASSSGRSTSSHLPDVLPLASPTIWDKASGLSEKVRRACEAAFRQV